MSDAATVRVNGHDRPARRPVVSAELLDRIVRYLCIGVELRQSAGGAAARRVDVDHLDEMVASAAADPIGPE